MTTADRPSVPQVGDTITTADQLDALPVGVVMRARNDLLMETGRLASGDRVVWGEGWSDHADAIEHFAPLTVLYVPGDRPSVTDNARAEAERRYPSDVADRGLTYPTGAVREHSQAAFVAGAEWAAGRAETATEDAAWEVIAQVRDAHPRDNNDASTDEIVAALADAGLLATARTRPTREQIARALDHAGAFCGECGAEPGDFFDSCLECQRWLLNYADAVLALLGGGDRG